MTYKFIWKLIDGDMYEQEFKGYNSLQEAFEAFYAVHGITHTDCEEFHVEEN